MLESDFRWVTGHPLVRLPTLLIGGLRTSMTTEDPRFREERPSIDLIVCHRLVCPFVRLNYGNK